jgi:hypothetical protein
MLKYVVLLVTLFNFDCLDLLFAIALRICEFFFDV